MKYLKDEHSPSEMLNARCLVKKYFTTRRTTLAEITATKYINYRFLY